MTGVGGDNDLMVAMVLWTFFMLGVAAVVLVAASVAGGSRQGPDGVRAYLHDVRAGLRTWRAERRGEEPPVAVAEPVDTSFEEFLDATTVHDPAYLGVEDLTDTLARTRDRATRGVPGFGRR